MAQLVESLPSKQEALGFIPSAMYTGRSQEAEKVEGHLWLQSELWASLGNHESLSLIK